MYTSLKILVNERNMMFGLLQNKVQKWNIDKIRSVIKIDGCQNWIWLHMGPYSLQLVYLYSILQ